MSIVPSATNISPVQNLSASQLQGTFVQRWARSILLKRLELINCGHLIIIEGEHRWSFGNSQDSLAAVIQVHAPEFWSAMMLGGPTAAGATYLNKVWDCQQLTDLIRLFCRNRKVLGQMDGGLAKLSQFIRGLGYKRQRNTKSGSDKNIRAHYDIGNDLFARMLDPMMMYSSAIYPHPQASLEEAAQHKCDVLIQALEVNSDHHVLEIGCGWGGFACHLAKQTGCKVTAITISREQEKLARQRVIDNGLQDLVTIQRIDYRDINGQFDRIVSIEMIEAVGKEFYPTFFKSCESLLKPNGKLVMQAITIADQEFERASGEVDFIKKYIFPGSCIPSLNALSVAAQGASDLRLDRSEDYGAHYAKTLADWRETIMPQRNELPDYPENFWRMWEFYLCYCEGGFAERALSLVHLSFCRPQWRSDAHDFLSYN